ncbi:cytochrome ubiquinol oxidase subunit I [Arsenicicoccus piscis]|uniref:Cytochrome ubiquinol oxidase subunit I n=1 Tax=Arsenicicoccus piscis TaxID=673954 RepID=A0ABQ6HUJ6_9MICO|nr:cytochrome ubiquinol oxidase subunit I [Arsenicicoccus piscis]MCH8626553.1 cytochrome ubiquinol oxidase subunit I [Arsenicicoccus piscis]GMA21199.1 cytochrome ubiquinol oxidase subunit I [Arsenicicoccus piscis]
MDNLDLARWQFAITTVYHFLFVPITIGMSAVVAGFHTAFIRTRGEHWDRLAQFFSKLFLINFALGLVTGIVQEFQFGMNWSSYSRFVGDIFGAPLAFEALLAFFLESTFLGLWIFGRGRMPEKLHAATIWIVHIGTVLSAYFILAANSFMQHPVGYRYNPETRRAELTDFVAVLFNKVQLVTFPHVIFAAYMAGGAMVLAVALWHWRRRQGLAELSESDESAGATSVLASRGGLRDREMYRRAARVGAIVTLVAGLGVVVSGDLQGKVMTEVQPMKMAAAEALYETAEPAPFSIFTVGTLDGSKPLASVEIPGLLSFLGTGSFSGRVQGINDLKKQYAETYAGNPLTADAGGYVPNIPLSYWTFRLMIGVGLLSMALAAWSLWITRHPNHLGTSRRERAWWHWLIIATPLLPVVGCSFGWIFTEVGRQPWLVFGQMTTATGVSPSVASWEVLLSMTVYTVLYAALAVIEVSLFLKYAKAGAQPVAQPDDHSDEDSTLAFAY